MCSAHILPKKYRFFKNWETKPIFLLTLVTVRQNSLSSRNLADI